MWRCPTGSVLGAAASNTAILMAIGRNGYAGVVQITNQTHLHSRSLLIFTMISFARTADILCQNTPIMRGRFQTVQQAVRRDSRCLALN